MKKIAIFQTDLNVGGIQKSLINLLNNIDYDKYEIDLYLTNKDNYFNNELNKNVNVLYLKKLPYFTRFIYFNILNKFYKNKITKKYDVAIDFNSYSMDTSLNAINCEANKKVIWVHNDIKIKLKEEKKYKILYTFFKSKYKKFDTYVAVSNGALNSFKEYHNYPNKKYMTIPNIIDTKNIIKKSKEKCDIEINNNLINICSVGRITHQKGFDILINDIKKLIKYRTDFHLYIIGDGEKLDSLKKLTAEYKLEKYITFIGKLANPYALMNKMDAFVLESRYEGQGMVFLEAKCLGLDIVMPKHLEKYVEGIKGTTDIVKSLNDLEKHKKEINELKKYNDAIIKEINELFDK